MFDDAITWLRNIVNGAFETISTFIYGILPDADSTITALYHLARYAMHLCLYTVGQQAHLD